MVKMH